MVFSSKKPIFFIITIAIVSGITRVLLDYSCRYLEISPILYYLTFLIAFIAEILVIIYTTKIYRTLKGSLTIVDALKIGVIIMGVVGLLYCTMAYIYDMHIDPNFQTDMTIRFTEQFSPDQIEQVKLNIKNQDTNKSYIGIIMYTIWFIFLGTTISLITGNILKTNQEIN